MADNDLLDQFKLYYEEPKQNKADLRRFHGRTDYERAVDSVIAILGIILGAIKSLGRKIHNNNNCGVKNERGRKFSKQNN